MKSLHIASVVLICLLSLVSAGMADVENPQHLNLSQIVFFVH